MRHSEIDERERDVERRSAPTVITPNQTSNLPTRKPMTSAISSSVGSMLKTMNESSVDAARAALDVAREAAGLALEVEAQRQRVQVVEDLERDAAHARCAHLHEDDVAQLVEERGRQAQQRRRRPAAPTGTASTPRGSPGSARARRRCCFITIGTPMLASLAATRKASASSTRQRYCPEVGQQLARAFSSRSAAPLAPVPVAGGGAVRRRAHQVACPAKRLWMNRRVTVEVKHCA